jgi:hypothetical protein
MHAWNPGYQLRLQCSQIITGGLEFGTVFSDYDGESIGIQNLENGVVDTVLKDRPVRDVQLSQSCRWITYCKFDQESSKSEVRIMTRSGQYVQTLTDARFYAWGTDVVGADCIVYIVGEDSNRESEGYQSRGTWLLNMASGEKSQIHPRGQELAWAEFDRSFYIGDWPNNTPPDSKVERYNMKTKKLEETPYHGIDFSTKGTYYHTRSYEGEGLSIYVRATNEEITNRYSLMLDSYFNGSPNTWLNDSMIVFGSYARMNVKNRIVDFERAEGWEVAEETVGFTDTGKKHLLTLVDGKLVKRKFEDVAKLIYPLPDEEQESTLVPSDDEIE